MKIKRIICIILAIILGYSSYKIWDYYRETYDNNITYDALRQQYYNNAPPIPPTEPPAMQQEINAPPIIMERYLPLLKINSDIIGWINIQDTVIDYPVLKTDNNEYYLTHDINHKESRNGAIFMDYRNKGDGTDRHTIIYGHNMRNNSMFKDLTKYKERDFFEQNNIIRFNTLFEEFEWEIFSVYVTDTNFYYIETDFHSDEKYMDFLNTIKGKSMFDKDIKLTKEDYLLTLSTCSYDFDDARFVVHARRLNKKHIQFHSKE
jgi:sortase B